MNLLWVNFIGIFFVLVLLVISIYPSRSSMRPTTRNRGNSRYRRSSSAASECPLDLGVFKRKSLKFRLLPFVIGFIFTILFRHYFSIELINLKSVFKEETSVYNKNLESSDTGRKIWFVVPTTYRLIQAPNLIRIAQAIFPVRHFVTLVLVKHYSIKNGIEHLSDLDRFLRRFSIPFVLLSTHQSREYLRLYKLKSGDSQGNVQGLLTGIAWVLQDPRRSGVLMMGNEEYTFTSAIFEQIRETEKVSSWPVAFGHHRSLSLGLTSPIVSKDGRVEGYFDGNSASWDTMPLELGAYALNIDYFRRNGSLENAWMLGVDFKHSLRDLGFGLEDVKPLGNNCSKILVWRTKCQVHNWPKKIQYNEDYSETNMYTLMRSVFGVRFQDYVRAETHMDNFDSER